MPTWPIRILLVKGTSMSFAGLKRDRDRADVIAFLTLMSDDPPEYVNPPSASEAPALPENPEFGILVSAPGAQETFDSCNACHSERIVAQQGLAREQWEELLELMVDEHGMKPIGGSVRESILDYLAEHYRSRSPELSVQLSQLAGPEGFASANQLNRRCPLRSILGPEPASPKSGICGFAPKWFCYASGGGNSIRIKGLPRSSRNPE